MRLKQFHALPSERKSEMIAWQATFDLADREKLTRQLKRDMGERFAYVGVENPATGRLKFLLPVLPDADVIWPDEE